MKKAGIPLLVAFLTLTQSPGPTFPNRKGYVNDFAQALPDDFGRQLEVRLRELAARTNVQVVLVTVKPIALVGTTGIQEYACELARRWGFEERSAGENALYLVVERKGAAICASQGTLKTLARAGVGNLLASTIGPQAKDGYVREAILDGMGVIVRAIMHPPDVEVPHQPQDQPLLRANLRNGLSQKRWPVLFS